MPYDSRVFQAFYAALNRRWRETDAFCRRFRGLPGVDLKGGQQFVIVEEVRMYGAYKKRIRDVREGPDGFVYLLTDEEYGELLRLCPKAAAQ